MCINSANNLFGWVLSDSSSWEEPHPSSLMRLPTPREVFPLLLPERQGKPPRPPAHSQQLLAMATPGNLQGEHKWRGAKFFCRSVEMDLSTQVWSNGQSPLKIHPWRQGDNGKGVWLSSSVLFSCSWLQNPSGIYFICFPAWRLVRMCCPKAHTNHLSAFD